MDNKNNEEKKSKKSILRAIIAVVVIVIIILLLLRSCGASSSRVDTPINQGQIQQEQTPQGNFEVGGKREEPIVEKEPEEVEYITFSGFGKFEVSKDAPNVELSNPAGNSVDMIFTLTDKATGDLIARTGKVHSGEYVYVNVMDYYSEKGSYFVTVNIETMNEANEPMNGLNQEMEIIVN